MNYFKILGLAFGIVAFLKPFYMHILPWDENRFIKNTYSEKRPWWIIPVALAGLALVAFTWYRELTTEIRYSMLITIMFSLTAIKSILFIVDYKAFQKWVAGMVQKEKSRKIVVVDILAGISGLLLIIASAMLL